MKPMFYAVCILLLLLPPGACKKLTEVPIPTTSVTGASVYTADATAISAVTALYVDISSSTLSLPGGIPSISVWTGLSADELTVWNGLPSLMVWAYFRNALTGLTTGYGGEYWVGFYRSIYSCNAALEGLNGSSGLTPVVKRQLQGEAYYMRAFFYFYLVNLFGELAMPLSTDEQINSTLARSPVPTVYRQIIADLQQAAGLLSLGYVDGTLLNPSAERVRPTRWAALALLARVDLYTGDWVHAERNADTVIANTGLFSLSSLNTAFLKASLGNNEAIWQLQPVNSGWNTEDAKAFIIPATGPASNGLNFGVYLSNALMAAFELGDQRRVAWVDSAAVNGTVYYYPFKYKVSAFGAPVNEYLTLFRLGELYLIRAEARAMQGELTDAAADLNVIRLRAGLGPTTAITQQDMLNAILHERQVELFTELGQRWFDLKRTGRVDSVMSVETLLKGGTWNSYQQLYPVSPGDIILDPNLTQNSGY